MKGSIAIALGAAMIAGTARAEPYRLRADAYASAPDPAAFVMIQAEAHERTPILFDAEALLWTGVIGPRTNTSGSGSTDAGTEVRGEAVIASVRLRDTARGWDLRFGRLLYQGGAVRPLHIDGAVAALRSPTGALLEIFGGLPVLTNNEGRSFDWIAGGRTTQAIGDVATVGYSYWQERDGGQVAHSELGVEGAITPAKAFALSSTAAFETDRFGLVEARISALLHGRVNRLELFGARRSPSRLLPATSLFAALGSYDADSVGLAGFWRAAPRLDLSAAVTVDRVADAPGATQSLRAELRLDDRGDGAIGVEAERTSMPGGSWTGARAFVRLPLAFHFTWTSEVEVAVPDEPRDRGVAWPWALLGLRYEPVRFLSAAAAFEASSTPQDVASIGGMLRVTGSWGVP